MRWANRVLFWVPTTFSLTVLCAVFALGRRGLVSVDEAYLLRLIGHPQATRPAGDVFLFGFVLHPLYEAVGRDVAVYRWMGFILMASAAAAMCLEGLALLRWHGFAVSRSQAGAALVTVAASSLVVFSFGVTSLAYRSIANLGLMAVVAGAARLCRSQQIFGGALIGAGGWTCFLGKPPSAGALFVVVTIFVVVLRLGTRRAITAAMGAGVLAAVMTLVVAQMTPAEAVAYLGRGAHHVALIGDHSGIALALGVAPLRLEGLLVFGPALLAAVAAGLLARRSISVDRRPARDVITVLGLAAYAVATSVVAVRFLGPPWLGWQALSVGFVLPVVAVARLVTAYRVALAAPARLRLVTGFVVFLLVLPYVSAVGSNVSFGVGMPLAGAFWAMALTVVAVINQQDGADGGRVFIALTLAAAVVMLSTVAVHTNGPAGGELAGRLESAPVEGGQLLLTPEQATAAHIIKSVAVRSGITEQTPVVDVTGIGSPYALMTGGRPLGRAHLYAYTSNRVVAARATLLRERCEDRAGAWLIYAPGYAGDMSAALGRALDLRTDYEVMAEFPTSYEGAVTQMRLLRPLPSVRRKLACPLA